ncbi:MULTISPECIES: nicotinate (nicotinamide) nucleotide adenylyltransferase [unclassified Achromobacter]|uniref:nicotinate (nicotinamide) nucleotide adenylyltransferase n=1 Tax=unclassified Achromobacter TaxID=2626865 RepID=UPI000B51696B|nr:MULTISPECIES: nicotinate (nicotinamide) nucleotide adenylyltransferase [unclassified Achromobacter]OWT67313.1 nicotinate (nicotinamide) nucleotide adenylyltransferase [Achromobacter sp. HZ34]OWT68040.1 nicotinate (nicotinamide) nucleotide adenylyltransferase [Achromobacter sp. HZ28]
MKKIGLLGGSFDPVHLAHMALARSALDGLHLDQVQLLPAGQPWQRSPLQASPRQRCDMIRLAIDSESGTAGIALNTIEVERDGPTYTVETLRALPPDAAYVWLLGADQLANFCTWHAWEDIVALVDLAVATRPGSSLTPPPPLHDALGRQGRQLQQLPFSDMPVSASEIRRRLAQDLPVDDLLPQPVIDYIRTHHLYHD